MSLGVVLTAIALWFSAMVVCSAAYRWKIWRWLAFAPPAALIVLFVAFAGMMDEKDPGAGMIGAGILAAFIFWPWIAALALGLVFSLIQRWSAPQSQKKGRLMSIFVNKHTKVLTQGMTAATGDGVQR